MHVLISGAGIAGPTLAWFLAKAGINVTVVEKHKACLAQGQNIDVDGSALTVLKKMGVLEKVKEFNSGEIGARFIDPKGKPFAPFPLKKRTPSPTSEHEILRGDLAMVLYNATKDLPNINYLFGVTVDQVLSNDEKSIKIKLSNGEIKEFDLTVAADGQWSKLRKNNFPSESVKVVDTDLFGAYYTIPRLADDGKWWDVYQAPGSRSVFLRPDPHGTMRACLSFMPLNETEKKLALEASRSGRKAQEKLLKKKFADAGWQTQRFLDALPQADDFYFQVMQQIRMTKWSKSRLVCIGDAAYAPTPLTGAGTDMAIVGAYVLAGELSKVKDGGNPAIACEEYEAKFRPHVEKTQKLPFFIPSIAYPASAWKIYLLQTAISLISKTVASPLVAGRFDTGADQNTGFKLPPYAVFDKEEQ
jgi:2-polyprenyl-6-methoxyphenol hydroxylase-like FAD-dependent oxidoreductase